MSLGADPANELPRSIYRFGDRIQWRCEQMTRLPAGHLVMGDALCSSNPIYAQDMSVAALEARVLGKCLAKGETKLASRFFQQASKIIDIPWSTAVGNDLSFAQIEGGGIAWR